MTQKEMLAALKALFVERYEKMTLEEVTHMAATIHYLNHIIGTN